jgi:phage N-6-adenine-methyltransferase
VTRSVSDNQATIPRRAASASQESSPPSTKHSVHYSSDRQDWGTPPSFISWYTERIGHQFNLDAAASAENAKADHYYTIEDNSLDREWWGHVWLNPPFGRELPQWLEKCAEQIKNPMVHSIHVLIPARTDTKWFHDIVMPNAYLVYLIKGRFNFRFDEATPGANAPFPSMLVVYRKHNLPDAGVTVMAVPKEARGYVDD